MALSKPSCSFFLTIIFVLSLSSFVFSDQIVSTTPLIPLTPRITQYVLNKVQTCGAINVTCHARLGRCRVDTNAVCGSTSYCNDSAICASLRSNNRSCTYDFQCKSRSCVNSVCTAFNYFKIGQSCVGNGECEMNGYCKCASTTDCTCQRKPAVGEACDTTNGCRGAALCDSSTSKCVGMFSLAAGTACSNTAECQSGLYCDTTCKTPAASSLKTCTLGGANNCSASGEICSCESFTDAYPTECVSQSTYDKDLSEKLTTLYKCVGEKGCDSLTYYDDEYKLQICKSCKKQYCPIIKDLFKIYDDWPSCANPYTEMYIYCDSKPFLWPPIVIGIGIGIAIIALCMGVFLRG